MRTTLTALKPARSELFRAIKNDQIHEILRKEKREM
jgi:hypothetical protein